MYVPEYTFLLFFERNFSPGLSLCLPIFASDASVQVGIAVADMEESRVKDDVVPLSARCKHPIDWSTDHGERVSELAH